MYRIAIEKLYKWKNSKRRKPLIIEGARQVGKTWLMKEFGKQAYADYVYINFEEETRPDYSDMIDMMNQRVADLRNGQPIPESIKSQIQSSTDKEDDGLIEGIKFD